jgi:hypothetical protein
MDVLKMRAMLEALKLKLFKYDKFKDSEGQEVDIVFLFIIEYRNIVLTKGCNISFLINQVKSVLRKTL